ncbi:hypothetical protein IP68_12460 [Blastomonas sp. AAP25]|uniref:hypothetical protein n=1 Tax=Blastomonas sp. AAP25 TaxID=1523416 RepID=UPI0006B9B007|nr:hypothetical protein [Blastomonas sp. AAP25]KPF74567.1 hypothetical protein IP68_12460 [Blastomonas sp. AAP25]
MTDLARLVLDADTRGLKSGERDLDNLGRQSRKTAGEVDSSAGMMASAFKKAGAAIVALGAADMAISFGKASVQAAIDAQEMQSAFEVVFGNMAEDVRAWAEETGNALGRSTQEIQRGALAFQELFGKALDPAQAAELSKQFAVLTQDLASFKNLSNEVAQQKLFSGLIGEAEPLRAVGVFLSEAAVQAKAAELGLRGVSGVLTDQEKIVARAAIIQEQLAAAQGDVERTGGSAANQIKTMNAAVEELQVALGTKLLPVFTPLISAVAQFITMLANAAQAININMVAINDFARGLQILSGYAVAAGNAFNFNFVGGISRAGSELWEFIKRMIPAIGYLERIIGLVRSLGAAERGTTARNQALRGPAGGFAAMFGTGGSLSADIARSNATMATTTTTLKNMGVSLGGVSAGAGSAGRAMTVAANDTKAAADRMKADIDGIMDRLFPLQGEINRLTKEMATLEAIRSQVGDAAYVRAREALEKQANALQSEIDYGAILPAEIIPQFKDWEAALGGFSEKAKVTAVQVTESFKDMATATMQSLSNLANAIRGGDFLDILQSVIGLGLQLGSMGAFGESVQTSINKPRSFDGGGYTGSGARSGGMDGKGGFLAMLHPRETVLDHTRGQGGGTTRVDVIPSPYFNVVVDGRIVNAAPALANAGAIQAQTSQANSGRRTVRR